MKNLTFLLMVTISIVLVGCEDYTDRGFSSEYEESELQAKGHKTFSDFVKNGRFEASWQAREAYNKGIFTLGEFNEIKAKEEDQRRLKELVAQRREAIVQNFLSSSFAKKYQITPDRDWRLTRGGWTYNFNATGVLEFNFSIGFDVNGHLTHFGANFYQGLYGGFGAYGYPKDRIDLGIEFVQFMMNSRNTRIKSFVEKTYRPQCVSNK